jgi:hypothetical protein
MQMLLEMQKVLRSWPCAQHSKVLLKGALGVTPSEAELNPRDEHCRGQWAADLGRRRGCIALPAQRARGNLPEVGTRQGTLEPFVLRSTQVLSGMWGPGTAVMDLCTIRSPSAAQLIEGEIHSIAVTDLISRSQAPPKPRGSLGASANELN